MIKCQESQHQLDMVFIDAFDGQDEVPASLSDPGEQQIMAFSLEITGQSLVMVCGRLRNYYHSQGHRDPDLTSD